MLWGEAQRARERGRSREAQEMRFSCWGSSRAAGSSPPFTLCPHREPAPPNGAQQGTLPPGAAGRPRTGDPEPPPGAHILCIRPPLQGKGHGGRCGCPAPLARERQFPPRGQGSRRPSPQRRSPSRRDGGSSDAHPTPGGAPWLRCARRGAGCGAGRRGTAGKFRDAATGAGTRPPALGAWGCHPGRSGQRTRCGRGCGARARAGARGGRGHLRVLLREAVGRGAGGGEQRQQQQRQEPQEPQQPARGPGRGARGAGAGPGAAAGPGQRGAGPGGAAGPSRHRHVSIQDAAPRGGGRGRRALSASPPPPGAGPGAARAAAPLRAAGCAAMSPPRGLPAL